MSQDDEKPTWTRSGPRPTDSISLEDEVRQTIAEQAAEHALNVAEVKRRDTSHLNIHDSPSEPTIAGTLDVRNYKNMNILDDQLDDFSIALANLYGIHLFGVTGTNEFVLDGKNDQYDFFIPTRQVPDLVGFVKGLYGLYNQEPTTYGNVTVKGVSGLVNEFNGVTTKGGLAISLTGGQGQAVKGLDPEICAFASTAHERGEVFENLKDVTQKHRILKERVAGGITMSIDSRVIENTYGNFDRALEQFRSEGFDLTPFEKERIELSDAALERRRERGLPIVIEQEGVSPRFFQDVTHYQVHKLDASAVAVLEKKDVVVIHLFDKKKDVADPVFDRFLQLIEQRVTPGSLAKQTPVCTLFKQAVSYTRDEQRDPRLQDKPDYFFENWLTVYEHLLGRAKSAYEKLSTTEEPLFPIDVEKISFLREQRFPRFEKHPEIKMTSEKAKWFLDEIRKKKRGGKEFVVKDGQNFLTFDPNFVFNNPYVYEAVVKSLRLGLKEKIPTAVNLGAIVNHAYKGLNQIIEKADREMQTLFKQNEEAYPESFSQEHNKYVFGWSVKQKALLDYINPENGLNEASDLETCYLPTHKDFVEALGYVAKYVMDRPSELSTTEAHGLSPKQVQDELKARQDAYWNRITNMYSLEMAVVMSKVITQEEADMLANKVYKNKATYQHEIPLSKELLDRLTNKDPHRTITIPGYE